MCRRPSLLWRIVFCSWLSASTCWKQVARLLSFLDGSNVFSFSFVKAGVFPTACQAHICCVHVSSLCQRFDEKLRVAKEKSRQPWLACSHSFVKFLVGSLDFFLKSRFRMKLENNYRFRLLAWNPGTMLF